MNVITNHKRNLKNADDDDDSSQMKEADKALTGMEKWCGLFVCPWNKLSYVIFHHHHHHSHHHHCHHHHHHHQATIIGLFFCPWNKLALHHHHHQRHCHQRHCHCHNLCHHNPHHSRSGKPHCRTQTLVNGKSQEIQLAFLFWQTNQG